MTTPSPDDRVHPQWAAVAALRTALAMTLTGQEVRVLYGPVPDVLTEQTVLYVAAATPGGSPPVRAQLTQHLGSSAYAVEVDCLLQHWSGVDTEDDAEVAARAVLAHQVLDQVETGLAAQPRLGADEVVADAVLTRMWWLPVRSEDGSMAVVGFTVRVLTYRRQRSIY